MSNTATRVVTLISGGGSNLQSLIDNVSNGALAAQLVAVVSDNPDAGGLQRAQHARIETQTVSPADYGDRKSFDLALASAIDHYEPELVILAGFMRILGPAFVDHYQGRLLNIHPSLLPDYRGLHTHRRVIAAGGRIHGCSIHFVTDVLDGGPLVAQAVVPVLAGDDVISLSARVQQAEHKLYPLVAGWFAGGRLKLRDGQVWLDDQRLGAPVRYTDIEEIA